MESLTPGTYYQDILADGTRSKLRQNFKHLRRTSFDTRPAVVQTPQIEVTSIPLPEMVLTPAQEEMVELKKNHYTIDSDLLPPGSLEVASLIEQVFGKLEESMTKL